MPRRRARKLPLWPVGLALAAVFGMGRYVLQDNRPVIRVAPYQPPPYIAEPDPPRKSSHDELFADVVVVDDEPFANVVVNEPFAEPEPPKNLADVLIQASSPEDECALKSLRQTGNSCYLDSVLMALFAVPNATINDIFFNFNFHNLRDRLSLEAKCVQSGNIDDDIAARMAVQAQLRETVDFIQGRRKDAPNTCIDFRKVLAKCKMRPEANFAGTDMQDAGEFATFLVQLFEPQIATRRERRFRLARVTSKGQPIWNQTPYFEETTKVSPVIYIHPRIYGDPFLENYIQTWNDTEIPSNRVGTSVRIMDSPFLMFVMDRRNIDTKTNRQSTFTEELIPPESITLDSGRILYLWSVVVKQGSNLHYVANFQCGGYWYEYNDLRPNDFLEFFSFDDMVERTTRNFVKFKTTDHGTVFIYTDIKPKTAR